ncbi:MAG: glucose-6-phosphate isomerase [Anaerolineae bacterium]
MNVMTPFQATVNLQNGVIQPAAPIIERRLSHMRRMYANTAEAERILTEEGDRLIYEVYPADLPEEEGHVLYCTTIIHPGTIGGEFHMTKGHYHSKRDRGEVYMGLAGTGGLLLQTEDGQTHYEPMVAGTVAYVPPYWAHRTMNTGTEPFIFFAAWPGDAGHDYGTIEELGFAKLVMQHENHAIVTDNPKYGA